MSCIHLTTAGGEELEVDLSSPIDLSIQLEFAGPQPEFFYAPPASSTPLALGDWIGDTLQGGGCNVSVHKLVPHCNGTHTECVGHIVDYKVFVCDLPIELLVPATLITVAPGGADGELAIGADAIAAALESFPGQDLHRGLILRTAPNDESKLTRVYVDDDPPPYLSTEAARLLVELGVEHLLVDLPSLDPMSDGGRLSAHHVFWGLPPGAHSSAPAARPHCSVTEMIFAPDEVPDGYYLLNLQLPPFQADAAPSRPVIYEVL